MSESVREKMKETVEGTGRVQARRESLGGQALGATESSDPKSSTLTSPRNGMRPGADIIAGRTGGQGKSTIAQFMAFAWERRGVNPLVVAVDTGGGSTVSKLGGLLPGVVEIPVSAEMADIMNRTEGALEHWEPLGDVLSQPAAVIDVGANVIQQILSWAQYSQAAMLVGGNQLNLILAVRDSEIAVADTVAVVEAARKLECEGGLAFSKVVLALNQILPEEDVLVRSSRGRLEALNVPMVKIPRNPVVLGMLERERKTFGWAYHVSWEEMKDAFPNEVKFGLTAKRYVLNMIEWLDGIDDQFVKIGLLPDTAKKRDFPTELRELSGNF